MIQADIEIFITLHIFCHSAMNIPVLSSPRIAQQ